MFHQNLPYVGKVAESISRDRSQYLVFIGLAVGILGFTGVLYLSNDLLFQRFIGRANPLTVFLFATVFGNSPPPFPVGEGLEIDLRSARLVGLVRDIPSIGRQGRHRFSGQGGGDGS